MAQATGIIFSQQYAQHIVNTESGAKLHRFYSVGKSKDLSIFHRVVKLIQENLKAFSVQSINHAQLHILLIYINKYIAHKFP